MRKLVWQVWSNLKIKPLQYKYIFANHLTDSMLQIFCFFAWSIAKERQWSDRLRTRKLVIKPRVLWLVKYTHTQCQLLRKFKWHQHFKSEKCNSFPLFLVVNYSPPFCIAPLSVNKDHRDGWGARWRFVRKAILKNYLLCKMDIKIWAQDDVKVWSFSPFIVN